MKEERSRVDLGDGLRQYMTMADECVQQLLASQSPFLAVLLRYDDYLRHDLWRQGLPRPTFAFLLFLNAYQFFLAGVRMALSGHPAAIFPLMRTALESASYGLLLEQQPASSEIWSNRHRSEADKKACRNAFSFDKAIVSLKQKAPDIHSLAREAYDGAIDYGAHPNPKGVFGHVAIDDARTDGMTAVTYTSLYSADHHETIRGLCACLDYGFLVISIIMLASQTPTEKIEAELQALNDAKESAIALYGSFEARLVSPEG